MGLVGCDRVEPGNVGIKVNKLGDDKGVGEVVGVGRYWTGWNTEVYIFPTFKQMKTYDEPFSFQMSDGTTIGYHIGVAYKVDPSKVTTVFQTYRKGVDDITDTDLRQKIADALNRLASKMTTDKFIDGGKSELLDAALKDIQEEMTPIGEYQKWNGTAWVKDTEAEKLFRIREAEETKKSLMQVASEHIAPLQDAADLEIATEEETSLLEAWKKYRVLLNRVDTSTAPDIEWPTSPAE
ncbi:hypothetical protein C6C13_25105 [Escherichia coli]|nr:hypothetical protein C6C13_25105 [Escherichia coli]